MNTINYNLPLIYQNQAMKEITHNEAICKIDLFLNKAALDMVEDLPSDPSDGDIYISGDELCAYLNGSWIFEKPAKNMIFYVVSKENFFHFDGVWKEI